MQYFEYLKKFHHRGLIIINNFLELCFQFIDIICDSVILDHKDPECLCVLLPSFTCTFSLTISLEDSLDIAWVDSRESSSKIFISVQNQSI